MPWKKVKREHSHLTVKRGQYYLLVLQLVSIYSLLYYSWNALVEGWKETFSLYTDRLQTAEIRFIQHTWIQMGQGVQTPLENHKCLQICSQILVVRTRLELDPSCLIASQSRYDTLWNILMTLKKREKIKVVMTPWRNFLYQCMLNTFGYPARIPSWATIGPPVKRHWNGSTVACFYMLTW